MNTPQQILIAIDQLANTLLGGWADETLSARAWRMRATSRWWAMVRVGIDLLFFLQKNHCMLAYESEKNRTQLDCEYR